MQSHKKPHFYLQILKYVHYFIFVSFGMNIISNEDEFVTVFVQLLLLIIRNVSIHMWHTQKLWNDYILASFWNHDFHKEFSPPCCFNRSTWFERSWIILAKTLTQKIYVFFKIMNEAFKKLLFQGFYFLF